MQIECSATKKTDKEENKAGAFSHAPRLVLAGNNWCGMGNVANVAKVANACGLVGRLQHDMQMMDCALSMSRPTAREQPVRTVQVCLWNDCWCVAFTCDGLGIIWRDIITKCRRLYRYYRTVTLPALWYICEPCPSC